MNADPVCGVLFSRTQTGSAFILIPSFFGAVPSSVTMPFTLPAVAVSTRWPDGVAAGDDGSADLFELPPPPHATSVVASVIPSTPTRAFRRRIEHSSHKRTPSNKQLPIIPCLLRVLRLLRFLQLALDAIGDPMRVPPLDRIHHAPADEQREVKMIAAGAAGGVAAADDLSARDAIADLHVERQQERVQRLHAHPVVEDHAVAVNAEPARVQHRAGVRRGDRHVRGDREIESEVRLLIDFLSLVDVRAAIREARLDL